MWSQGRFPHENRDSMARFAETASRLGFPAVEINYVIPPEGVEEILASDHVSVASLHSPTPRVKAANGRWSEALNLAAADEEERDLAVRLACETVDHAVRAGARYVVVHLGGIESGGRSEMFEGEKRLRRLFGAGGGGGGGGCGGGGWGGALRSVGGAGRPTPRASKAPGATCRGRAAPWRRSPSTRPGAASPSGWRTATTTTSSPASTRCTSCWRTTRPRSPASGWTSATRRCWTGWGWSPRSAGWTSWAPAASAPTSTTWTAWPTTPPPAPAPSTGRTSPAGCPLTPPACSRSTSGRRRTPWRARARSCASGACSEP